MTAFEQLCEELGVEITLDDRGRYSGLSRALAYICVDVIMSNAAEPTVIDEVKKQFFAKFPYMQK